MIFIEIVLFIGFLILLYLSAETIFLTINLQLRGWKRLVLLTVIGTGLFVFYSYVLEFLNLRIFILPFLVLSAGISFYFRSHWLRQLATDWKGPHIILLIISIFYAISMYTSGYVTSQGTMHLKVPHYTDALWNIALTRSLMFSFPPEHPSIAGVALKGYHFLYNLFLAEFLRYLPISILRAYFVYFPLLFSGLLVYGFYYLSLNITKKTSYSLWATVLAIYGGSFAYLVPLFWGHSISWDDGFGINQPVSLLVNPSLLSSIVFIIYSILILDLYNKVKKPVIGLIFIIISGLLIGFKVYAGMIFYTCLFIYSFYQVIFNKQAITLKLFIGIVFISCLIFLPFNAKYGFLVYYPFWPFDRMMTGTLDFTQWELKRQTLRMLGSKLGIIKLEIIAFLIFLFGNLGTRTVGLLFLEKKYYPWKNKIIGILFLLIIISFVIPLFFIQPIGAFNMIQMYWYFLVFVGFISGFGFARIFSKFNFHAKIIFIIIIAITTLPSAYEKITKIYLYDQVPTLIQTELDFYNHLSYIGSYKDIVLVVPDLAIYTTESVRDWVESSIPDIPALGNKRQYLGGEVVQFKYDDLAEIRISEIVELMQPQNMDYLSDYTRLKMKTRVAQILINHKIKYIVTRNNKPVWFEGESWINKSFQNTKGSIFEVMLNNQI